MYASEIHACEIYIRSTLERGARMPRETYASERYAYVVDISTLMTWNEEREEGCPGTRNERKGLLPRELTGGELTYKTLAKLCSDWFPFRRFDCLLEFSFFAVT
jgi:hypothetical protein